MTPLEQACEIIRNKRLPFAALSDHDPRWVVLYHAEKYLRAQGADESGLRKNSEGEWEVFSGSTITDLEAMVARAEAK